MLSLTVSDVMTENPEYVRTSDTVRSAESRLYELDIRHLPVVDDESGELVGVISDRDLREFDEPYELGVGDPTEGDVRDETRCSQIMRGDVITAHPDDGLADLVDTLIDQKIGAVPVIEPLGGELVGIVSYVDVLRVARDEFLE